jgi:hypothetical protein
MTTTASIGCKGGRGSKTVHGVESCMSSRWWWRKRYQGRSQFVLKNIKRGRTVLADARNQRLVLLREAIATAADQYDESAFKREEVPEAHFQQEASITSIVYKPSEIVQLRQKPTLLRYPRLIARTLSILRDFWT